MAPGSGRVACDSPAGVRTEVAVLSAETKTVVPRVPRDLTGVVNQVEQHQAASKNDTSVPCCVAVWDSDRSALTVVQSTAVAFTGNGEFGFDSGEAA